MRTTHPARRSLGRRSLGMIVLLVTFAAGVAIGALMTRLSSSTEPHTTLRPRNMSAILDKLQLSTAQRVAADSILDHSEPRTDAIMLELAQRLGSVADSVDGQLRAILTPAQRQRLDALRKKPIFMLKRNSVNGETVDTVFRSRSR